MEGVPRKQGLTLRDAVRQDGDGFARRTVGAA